MEEAPASANKFAVSLSSVKMYLRFLSISRIPPACVFRIERRTNFHCHARRDRMARRSWYIFRGTGRVLRRYRIADPWYFRESSAPRIRAIVSVSHGDPFRAAISRRESPFDRTDGDLSFRLLTAGSPEEWPRKCYPLECPSIPPLFISLSFFSRLGRVVENSLGEFGRVNSPCSRASTRNCFLVAGGKRTDGVAQCASPSRGKVFPRAGFWT